MNELLPLSVGLGLAVSLLISHFFGFAVGGLVVPGYLALSLNRPVEAAATIVAGLATLAVVRGLETFLIVYGRRRTVLTVLVGYLIAAAIHRTVPNLLGATGDWPAVGFIIPGLIALWMDRQGVFDTLAALLTTSVTVRLILVICLGGRLVG
jgi:poly-gamma-glutamate biosynthesis protein PgsC/CapC